MAREPSPYISFWSKSEEGKELSNFFPSPVTLTLYSVTYTFPHAEGAYQAHKVEKGNQEQFLDLAPQDARTLGRSLPYIDQWGEISKDAAMKRVLRAKFTQNEKLGDYLISTYPKKLIHWAPWDNYWGWSKDNNGWNRLGDLLMEVRDEIR